LVAVRIGGEAGASCRLNDTAHTSTSHAVRSLNAPGALVVQPDIIFVSARRRAIVGDRVFGPPDLVVEILLPGTARRDRTTKLEWYRRYGVGECWLVDISRRTVEVIGLQAEAADRRTYGGDACPRSAVLPHWDATVAQIFD
jgi:Uma2 family endonuclease